MILLTSESKRRKELLEQIGFSQDDFIQVDVPVNFKYHKEKDRLTLDEVKEMAIQDARLKVHRAVNESKTLDLYALPPEKTVVVGADTVVFFDGRVLDRPLLTNYASAAQIEEADKTAIRMLTQLKGQKIYVITSVVVAQGDNLSIEEACCVVTEGQMREFSDEDIECYVATGEPRDKAGAFGIQGQGVVLFEQIKGSYSNVVGLPLVEFVDILRSPKFAGRVRLPLVEIRSVSSFVNIPTVPVLSVVAVGDIRCDFIFDELPAGFFNTLSPPGRRMRGELRQDIGGTAALFARHALKAGFKECSVLGTISGDALGKWLEERLHEMDIRPLLPANYKKEASVAFILRDQAKHDTSLTITNTPQPLSESDVNSARIEIKKAHVVFISSSCLTDLNGQGAARKVIEWAKEANQLVVLDVTVDMDRVLEFADFVKLAGQKVDVLVAEIRTLLAWLHIDDHDEQDWSFIKDRIIPELRGYFPTMFLRTSTYSHEMSVTPNKILGPLDLDYSQRPADERLGYADERTAQHLYTFMSPRVLLASSSPRRFELLKQIMAETKLEVLNSQHDEASQKEEPKARVMRLSSEKAQRVLARRDEFSPSIEVVIGADTEIVLDGEVVGNPKDNETAYKILSKLSGRTHEAITGITVLGIKNERAVTDCVSTKVTFKQLSKDEIEHYIQSGEPIGKAGAYGIQGIGVLFVESIEGSYSNVIGLPLERLSNILQQDFGIPVWDINKVSNWTF